RRRAQLPTDLARIQTRSIWLCEAIDSGLRLDGGKILLEPRCSHRAPAFCRGDGRVGRRNLPARSQRYEWSFETNDDRRGRGWIPWFTGNLCYVVELRSRRRSNGRATV